MDKKVMAIVIVVAAVAIIGCVLLATHKDGSKCDYTLLDSSDNACIDPNLGRMCQLPCGSQFRFRKRFNP